MSIIVGTFFALLLISMVSSISSVVGQNVLYNSTSGNIDDLVDSATSGNIDDLVDSATSGNIDDLVDSATSGNIDDLVDSATSGNIDDLVDSVIGREDPPSSLVVDDTYTSFVTASDMIMINEVELNPGDDEEVKEWVELYNPTDVDVNISGFEIITSSKSATIEIPSDAVIEAHNTFVIEVNRQVMSNTGESLVLVNATGHVKDMTPSLVDRGNDDRTWQRIPDGNNEWQFLENTYDSLNDPDSDSAPHASTYPRSGVVECSGSASCMEGIVIRVVDAGTIYVRLGDTAYKVDLALIEAPTRVDERFSESTAFTRDLCLGSTVLVDQDGMVLTSGSSIIASVYCSSSNLNSELLDKGYADLDVEQCATSEFAIELWAKDHGC